MYALRCAGKKMSEESVLLQMEDDTVSENKKKVVSSKFELFSHVWRSFAQFMHTFLQYEQCKYLNDLFQKQDLSNILIEKCQKYEDSWMDMDLFNGTLLDNLETIATKNSFEEEQKNIDMKYLNELLQLLKDVDEGRRHSLITLPKVPANKMTFVIQTDEDDRFGNLIYFYAIVYGNELSTDYLLEMNEKILKKVNDKKQKLNAFIKTFLPYDETVWQRWIDLQDFLINHFNQQSKQNKSQPTEETQRFYLFLKLLLDKDQFKKQIEKLHFKDQFRYMNNLIYADIKFDVERLFLIILLDIQCDFRKLIKAQQKIIKKSLNGNFPNEWRRMLHLPMTVLRFQQYRVYCSYAFLETDEKPINRFREILPKVIDYVINALTRIEILKNSSTIIEFDQFIDDEEFLNDLLGTLWRISDGNDALIALPTVRKLNGNFGFIPSEDQLNDIALNLHYFYKLFINQRKGFDNWIREVLVNIRANLHALDTFMTDYMHIQNKDDDFSLLWDEFRLFHTEENIVGQIQMRALYGLIFNSNRQWKDELLTVQPMEYPFAKTSINQDKMCQMQIYILLILNESVDIINVKKDTNFNSNLNLCNTIILQLVNSLIFFTPMIHKHFHRNLNRFQLKKITLAVEKLMENYNTQKDLDVYNNLLAALKNATQSRLKSMEVLQEIENQCKLILSLKNNNQTTFEKQQILILNLYCFWRLFVNEKECTQTNFYKWTSKMLCLVLLNLTRIDLYIDTVIMKNELKDSFGIAEKWNYLKTFVLQTVEIDSDSMEVDDRFALLLEFTNLSELEYFLNSINVSFFQTFRYFDEIAEFDLLMIILLDMPYSMKQIAHFLCWQEISLLNNAINCKQFYYLQMINVVKKNQKIILRSLNMREYKKDIEDFNKCLFEYEKLNNSRSLSECLKEAKPTKSITYFFLDDIPPVPTNNFQLQTFNNTFLIQFQQIVNLYCYFQIITVDTLQGQDFNQLIRYLLKHIHKNFKEMDQFINDYFENFENFDTFKANWNLLKEKINQLSARNLSKSFQILFNYFNDFVKPSSFDMNVFLKRFKLAFEMPIKEVDQSVAAKHVLLIFLNVPLSKISKSKYKDTCSLDESFSLMYLYKEVKPFSLNESIQYDLITDKFLNDLQQNGSSQIIVKSEFNQLDRKEKVAIIDNVLDIVKSEKIFKGYNKMLIKVFFSLLPLIDVLMDIFLAIKFFFSNEMPYFYGIIGILLITGVATVITERILEKQIKWKPTVCVKILGNGKLKYLLSFTQISLFLRTLNEALLRLKIKNNETNSYLAFINYGDPEFLKKETATMKYVELCFEAIPQTILQLYIILIRNKSNPLQLLSIFTSICSAMIKVWRYISSRNPKQEPSFIENRTLLIREFCFYGLRIISTSLILLIFSWPILLIWLLLRFSLDLTIGILTGDFKTNNYGLFNGIHSDLMMDSKIYNIATFIEFLIDLLIFAYNLRTFSNNIYYDVLIMIIYPILFSIWTRLAYLEKFGYSVKWTAGYSVPYKGLFEFSKTFPFVRRKNSKLSDDDLTSCSSNSVCNDDQTEFVDRFMELMEGIDFSTSNRSLNLSDISYSSDSSDCEIDDEDEDEEFIPL